MLPINEKKEEILRRLRGGQVVIVCGETGSGKTTQLPQFCLEAGFADGGKIAITQPRRIAAVSICARIAHETNTAPGTLVGYEVRFARKMSDESKIICMTDGILLAHAAKNKNFDGYSVIIIDEAHERSLNIDLIIGCLRGILPQRPDLRVVISSATMDSAAFSEAFGGAPIINVSGRMFPVAVIYDDDDGDPDGYVDKAVKAVEKIRRASDGDGDVLVFMPTERDVLETARKLSMRYQRNRDMILPLFSRLNLARQNKIFEPTSMRKVIVATNIAETSITIEGIKYVVDSGLVRIAKYAANLRTNRLPIEEASKAELTQRAGRCGRVGGGICVRLYSKKNFDARPEFRTPEIQRLNLAGVVLQMLNLNFCDLYGFPFIQAPQKQRIDDAVSQLYELSAIENKDGGAVKNAAGDLALTHIGRLMAKFALEPHVSRMIIQAQKEGVSMEVAVIAAGLSIVDPRERPSEKESAADNAHRKFVDVGSDFMSLLKMWSVYHEVFDTLKSSQKAMRDYCEDNFLSYNRMREWCDVYEQIRRTLCEYDKRFFDIEERINFADVSETKRWAIHKSIFAGLIGNAAVFDKEKDAYVAAKGRVCRIFPGSALAGGKKRRAQWIMAQQITETSRVFARTLGPIEPIWIEEFAPNLIKRKYSAAFYDAASGSVVCEETLFFYGLKLPNPKKRFYGNIDAVEARKIFIQSALVEENCASRFPFLHKNAELCEKIREIEIRNRVVGRIFSPEALFAFYDKRIGENISSDKQLRSWLIRMKRGEADEILTLREEDITAHPLAPRPDTEVYPDFIEIGNTKFPLSYRCDFGREDDGITVEIPQKELPFVRAGVLDWAPPPLLGRKVEELIWTIRSKELRRKFIPIRESAQRIYEDIKRNYPRSCELKGKVFAPPQTDFFAALCAGVKNEFGLDVSASDFDSDAAADYLKIRVCVVSKDGCIVGFTRNLSEDAASLMKNSDADSGGARLGVLLAQKTIRRFEERVRNYDEYIKSADLDAAIIARGAGEDGFGYPALRASEDGVDAVWFASPEAAAGENPFGLAKLLEFSMSEDLAWLRKNLRFGQDARLLAQPFGGAEFVSKRLYEIIRGAVCFPVINVSTWREFDCVRGGRLQILRRCEAGGVDNFVKFADSVSRVGRYLDANIAKTPSSKRLPLVKNEIDGYVQRFLYGYCPLSVWERYRFYIDALACKADKCMHSPKHYEECEGIIKVYREKSAEFAADIRKNPVEFEIFVERFCFLVEELSLKLFAEPKIKPVENVSVKKLDKFLSDF